ncbi:MAG: hypothetical protein M5U34_02860 [Chloroflexi bacterium]|nr:hypothetical protein [Chloroflexota bacterium]
MTGLINSSHAFTTTIFPTYATQPITTTWVATGQETITQTGGVTATQSWQWPSSGLKTITVTAQNASGSPVTATHQISIENPANLTIGPLELATTPPITVSTPVVFRATISNTGEEAITSQFYVDVFINPTHINDDYISLDQSSGYTAVSALAAQSSRVVTLTAPSGFPPDVITHSVYAMVDSLRTIAEPLESDNIWGPLTVTGILPPTPLITVTPTCSSTPTATITVNGAHWPLDEEVALYFDGDLRTLITDHDGSFNTSWLEQSISVGQEYEITAVSPSHSASTTFTTPCQPAGPESVTITGPAVGAHRRTADLCSHG